MLESKARRRRDDQVFENEVKLKKKRKKKNIESQFEGRSKVKPIGKQRLKQANHNRTRKKSDEKREKKKSNLLAKIVIIWKSKGRRSAGA